MNTTTMAAVIVGVPALVALYALECWLWPYENCPRCGGGGRRSAPQGGKWGLCRHCGGSGRRLRLGRRLWDARQDRRRR